MHLEARSITVPNNDASSLSDMLDSTRRELGAHTFSLLKNMPQMPPVPPMLPFDSIPSPLEIAQELPPISNLLDSMYPRLGSKHFEKVNSFMFPNFESVNNKFIRSKDSSHLSSLMETVNPLNILLPSIQQGLAIDDLDPELTKRSLSEAMLVAQEYNVSKIEYFEAKEGYQRISKILKSIVHFSWG